LLTTFLLPTFVYQHQHEILPPELDEDDDVLGDDHDEHPRYDDHSDILRKGQPLYYRVSGSKQ